MRFLTIFILLLIISSSDASEISEADRPPPLDCQFGPLHKTFGNTQWLLYACDDGLSAVVVSDTGNPAMPFYFIIYVKPNGDIRLYGEGTGKKSATKSAFDDLAKLTVTDVAGLVQQARAMPTTGAVE